MATIGVDCGIIINSVGYIIKEDTYQHDKKRLYSQTTDAQFGNVWIDAGPLFDEVKCTLILWQNQSYKGQAPLTNAFSARSVLFTLYNVVATSFSVVLPTQESITMRFMDYKEHIPKVAGWVTTDGGATYHPDAYEIDIQLIKA